MWERTNNIERTMIDLNQNTLFGDKVISTISFNEQEIIRDILYLHSNGNYIECDPTFSIGNFYKDGLPKPKHIFDKSPQLPDVVEAMSDKLPLENSSINVLMFDPPFVIGASDEVANNSQEGSSIIQKRFTGFKDFLELKTMYYSSLKEFYRVLKDKGIVIFKCQDVVSSSKQHFSHSWLMLVALKCGFYPKDLFILLSKNRLVDGRKQQHARKFHSYFWVFSKDVCKVNYGLKDIEGYK